MESRYFKVRLTLKSKQKKEKIIIYIDNEKDFWIKLLLLLLWRMNTIHLILKICRTTRIKKKIIQKELHLFKLSQIVTSSYRDHIQVVEIKKKKKKKKRGFVQTHTRYLLVFWNVTMRGCVRLLKCIAWKIKSNWTIADFQSGRNVSM